jgi:thiamine biosynthesis lipoprotein
LLNFKSMDIMKKFCYPIVLCLCLFSSGCGRAPQAVTDEKLLLDTLVTIRAYDTLNGKDSRAKKIFKEAFDRAEAVEARLDVHKRGSETDRLNRRAANAAIPISEDLWTALTTGQKVYRQTQGAFDLTVGPVTSRWDFEKKRVPDARELRAALTLVDGKKLELKAGTTPEARLRQSNTQLDLGGIAKGVGVDRMADVLRRRGLQNSLINAISNVTAVGPKPDGSPWRVGIQSPRPETSPGMIAVIELKQGSISTSGDYQKTFTIGARRYHHVIDPKTGQPAPGFMSVTVVTDRSAAYADALSTGLAVMGRKKALRLVENLPGTDVFFVDENGRFWSSSGLGDRLRLTGLKIK